MILNLQPHPEGTGDIVVVEVDPKFTLENVIAMYRHHRELGNVGKIVIMDEKGTPLPNNKSLNELEITDGQTLKIGFKDEIPSMKRRGITLLIIGIVVIVLILIIFSLSVWLGLRSGREQLLSGEDGAYITETLFTHRSRKLWCENLSNFTEAFGVVVDGGTTRTCAVSYSWNENKYKGTGCVKDEEMCCVKEGLIHADAANFFRRIMRCVTVVLNSTAYEVLDDIPIYFGATGNMRRQKIINQKESTMIMNLMKKYLLERYVSIKEVHVITGQDEGLYRWIATNHIRNTFRDDLKKNPPRYGSLNLEEDSLDISFEKRAPGKEDQLQNVTLYGKTYEVFTQSYMCFGRKSAHERYYTFLLIQNITKTEIEDPCLPLNFTVRKRADDLFQRVCTHNSRFTNHLRQDPDIMETVYHFKGTSHPNYCKGNISLTLDEEVCLKLAFKECFRKIKVPRKQKFVAYSSFSSTLKFLNATRTTLEEFKDIANTFCRNDIDQVNEYTDIPKKYRAQLCFDVLYIHELLVRGYGFTKTLWKNLNFVKGVIDEDLTWTMGYMIRASNNLHLNDSLTYRNAV